MTVPLVVFLGAGIGGLARYALGGWVQALSGGQFPVGTLTINVTGSLLLGLAYGFLEGTAVAPEWRAFVGIGLLGGYTTFSTFSYESVHLLQDGEWGALSAYVLGSVLMSMAAAFLGLHVGALALGRS